MRWEANKRVLLCDASKICSKQHAAYIKKRKEKEGRKKRREKIKENEIEKENMKDDRKKEEKER